MLISFMDKNHKTITNKNNIQNLKKIMVFYAEKNQYSSTKNCLTIIKDKDQIVIEDLKTQLNITVELIHVEINQKSIYEFLLEVINSDKENEIGNYHFTDNLIIKLRERLELKI